MVQSLRTCQVRASRIKLWLEGGDEFPKKFEELDKIDQEKVRHMLGDVIYFIESQQVEIPAKDQIAALPDPENRKEPTKPFNVIRVSRLASEDYDGPADPDKSHI